MDNLVRIIFVDDEPNVLAGLKRMLRKKHKEWDMHFVESGSGALALMEQYTFDIIVSDIRMPGMDGAELLSRVRNFSPKTIRIALSGQVDMTEVLRSIKAVHQYISKPCEADYLIERLEGAIRSQAILTNQNMLELITKVESLPIIPDVYKKTELELRKKEPSIKVIADYITQDVGLVTKIIKLINSPYFGLPAQVDSIEKAITMLGLDTIRAFVLSTHLFTLYEEKILPLFSLSLLWKHSFRVSNIAHLIAKCENASQAVTTQCRMAGLLHDVGKLVMANSFPEKYTTVLKLVSLPEGIPVHKAEKSVFGTTHAEVGAYLMGLWGMSNEVVHAIGRHHSLNDTDNIVALYLSAADTIDQNFVLLNDRHTPIQFETSLKPMLLNEDKLSLWLAYIKANWPGDSPLAQMPPETIIKMIA
nr:response regulator [uncultured Pseudodesulfovibrio sp.]